MEKEKKATGNVRTTSEVESQPRKRDRKASRKSLADLYRETTSLRVNTVLFGQEIHIDNILKWRVKWGQRGTGTFGLIGLICFIAKQRIPTAVFGTLTLMCCGILYYKNVSLVIAKRLARETYVVMFLVLALCNWIIDIALPSDPLAPLNGFFYVLIVSTFVFVDAVKVKSRIFMIAIGIIFVSANINNVYNHVFGDSHKGVVLLKYSMHGNEYTFMKRSTKRSIYIQIMLFGMKGIYTIFKDRQQELMIFATGHIYRETGTSSKEVEEKQYSMKIQSEKKILSENTKLEIARNTKKGTGRSIAEVDLQPKRSKTSRNSWTEIYNETTVLHKHTMLLGQKLKPDDGLERQVKWGQGGLVFSFWVL